MSDVIPFPSQSFATEMAAASARFTKAATGFSLEELEGAAMAAVLACDEEAGEQGGHPAGEDAGSSSEESSSSSSSSSSEEDSDEDGEQEAQDGEGGSNNQPPVESAVLPVEVTEAMASLRLQPEVASEAAPPAHHPGIVVVSSDDDDE